MVSPEKLKSLKEGAGRGRVHFFIISDRDNPRIGEVIGVQPAVARTYLRRDLPPIEKGKPPHSLTNFDNYNKDKFYPIQFADINTPAFLELVKYLSGFKKQDSFASILDTIASGASPENETETPERAKRGRKPSVKPDATDATDNLDEPQN
jgi:hypothetical protein